MGKERWTRCDEGKRGQRNILPELSKYFSSLRPFAVVYSRAKCGNKFPSYFYRLLRPPPPSLFFAALSHFPSSNTIFLRFSFPFCSHRKQGQIFSGNFAVAIEATADSRRRRSSRARAEQARNTTSSRANSELKNGKRKRKEGGGVVAQCLLNVQFACGVASRNRRRPFEASFMIRMLSFSWQEVTSMKSGGRNEKEHDVAEEEISSHAVLANV